MSTRGCHHSVENETGFLHCHTREEPEYMQLLFNCLSDTGCMPKIMVEAPSVDGENKEEILSNIPGKVMLAGNTDEDLYLVDREIAPMENSI
ncbi:hypothetical protein DV589_24900 [Salmonella enterica]|nr:hypothetical protein [Salmonella enterica]EHJ5406801.1 hypothetical protein [Salmonella enterica subsp. enterica serovar Wedding]EKF0976938.1 hypothetical protein [Salmonella enterica]